MGLIDRLRRRVINAPNRERRAYWLRAYLRAKARAGRFDTRMLNGHPGNIGPACKKAVCRGVAAGVVVTSTTDGKHATTSYHYHGAAVDFGLRAREVGTAKGRAKLVRFQRAELKRGASRYNELFGPDNAACVKGGRRVTLTEGTGLENLHDNHVHESPRD